AIETVAVTIATILLACADWVRASHDTEFHRWWQELAMGFTAPVTLHLPDGVEVRGLIDTIDAQGALMLDGTDGERHVIAAGDLRWQP
ncbi:MAG: hypothetical protein ABI743_07270, partial [bacterium]